MVKSHREAPPRVSKYACSMGDPMDMLGEEACEVGKEVFKFKRFGHYPDGGRIPGYTGVTAIEALHQEIGDFLAVMVHLIVIKQLDSLKIHQAIRNKRAKVLEQFGETLLQPSPGDLIREDF